MSSGSSLRAPGDAILNHVFSRPGTLCFGNGPLTAQQLHVPPAWPLHVYGAQPYNSIDDSSTLQQFEPLRLVDPCVARQGLNLGLIDLSYQRQISRPSLHHGPSSGSAAVFLDTAATGSTESALKQALPLQAPLPWLLRTTARCDGADHSHGQVWPDRAHSDGAWSHGPVDSLLLASRTYPFGHAGDRSGDYRNISSFQINLPTGLQAFVVVKA